jgi:FKBP-type peptidyl-prolyl cis-trans isomerase
MFAAYKMSEHRRTSPMPAHPGYGERTMRKIPLNSNLVF